MSVKVLHTTLELSGGGAETQLVNLINYSEQSSIKYGVFCVDDSAKFRIKRNVPIYTMSRKKKFDLNVFNEINSAIKEFNPDIVHTWLPHYVNIPALMCSKFNGIKNVFSFRNSRKLNSIKDMVEYFFTLLFSDNIVSNTDVEFCDKVYSFLFNKKNSEIIYNGYPISKIKNEANNDAIITSDKKFNLLFVGRLVEQKNIFTLIKAFSKLPNKSNFHLNICGKGPKEAKLKSMIKKLSLTDYIDLLGYREDIYSIMKSSDLLILPSKYEGMPNVIFEAMALGLPVLVSNIPQHTKWINHNENGFLFNVEDIYDLKEKILLISKSTTKYKMVKKEAFNLVNDFDIEKLVNMYEKFYKELAN